MKKKLKFAKIYLVRHGEIKNPKNIIYGYLPLQLDKQGRLEAKQAGLFLKDKKIVAIYASPMRRTQETAKIINQIISRGKIKIETNKDLRESGWGKFLQGLSWKEARHKYPKQVSLYWRQPAKLTVGEGLKKMAERTLKVIWQGIKKYPGQNFVIVSHQDVILAPLLKISKKSFNDLPGVKSLCPTGAVIEVDFIGKRLINKNF